MRIIISKELDNFTLRGGYTEIESESNDGMRRGSAYHVETTTEFILTGQRQEEVGYSYDLIVRYQTDWRSPVEWADADQLVKHLGEIVGGLKLKGATLLQPAVYSLVYPHANRTGDGDTVSFTLGGHIYLATEEDAVITAEQALDHFNERGTDCQQLRLARAFGDLTPYGETLKVDLSSISDELFQLEQRVVLPAVSLRAMIAAGEVTAPGAQQALIEYVGREKSSYYPIGLEEVADLITDLPSDLIGQVLRHCRATPDNLDFFRAHYPQGINWRSVPLEAMQDSDLDLMIQCGEHAYTREQWQFIGRCMAQPDLERKVVDNAYLLGYCDLQQIIGQLHTCTPEDVLRSALRVLSSQPGHVRVGYFSQLFDVKYSGLEQGDYDMCLAISRRAECQSSGERSIMTAFALKVGISSGIPDTKLAEMLCEKTAFSFRGERVNHHMRHVYQELNFAPGLAWIQAEDERIATLKAQAEKQQAESSEQVVQFVQQSGKLSVRVGRGSSPCDGEYKARTITGEEIGTLRTSDGRVLVIEGRTSDYLINVERVKRLKNGVLHLDVHKDDAGYVIGTKGKHLNAAAQRLRDLECPVRTVRAHVHESNDF